MPTPVRLSNRDRHFQDLASIIAAASRFNIQLKRVNDGLHASDIPIPGPSPTIIVILTTPHPVDASVGENTVHPLEVSPSKGDPRYPPPSKA